MLVLQAELVRELRIKPRDKGRQHIAAASSLVIDQGCALVIADDELHVAAFSLHKPRQLGTCHPLLEGTLPTKAKARKREKPDFEGLVILGEKGQAKQLLALPSGSRPNRLRAVLSPWPWRRKGRSTIIDCEPLYTWLERFELGPINIEGAVRANASELFLVQRGNDQDARNALVVLDYQRFVQDLGHRLPHLGARSYLRSIDIKCPKIRGVTSSLTDICVLPGGDLLVSAAAEDTDNAYDDGACLGSFLLRLDRSGRRIRSFRLAGHRKIEGIAASQDLLWLVTDDDDPSHAAGLYRLPLGELSR